MVHIMSLYDEYESYLKQYKNEYGKNTIVLYRCGGFYEIYSINDGLIDIKYVCDLLNIQMSRRNKAILEVNRSNTLMAGFPAHALQKFVNVLVSDNFTVVIVDQITDPPKPKRAVTAIISPGTDLNITSQDTNNLMCINIEKYSDFKTKKQIMCIGISIIDLTTGTSKIIEVSSSTYDSHYALDETFRLIQTENPKEIIFIGSKPSDIDYIQYLELTGKCIHDKFSEEKEDTIIESNINYQTELLRKIFPKHGLLSVIEFLDLEKYQVATTSFVFLLQFSYKHNENILQRIKKPIILQPKDQLVLSYNCTKHLNIISDDSRINSLLSMLNKATTAIGKRLFKELFLNPIINIDILENRYDCVDFMLDNNTYETVTSIMNNIYDIERLNRKINMYIINPCELWNLFISLDSMLKILDIITNSPILNNDDSFIKKTKDIILFLNNHLDLQEIQKYNIDNITNSFFIKGKYGNIDKLQDELNTNISYLELIVKKLNETVKGDFFKLEHNLIDGYHLTITSKRHNDTKKILDNFKIILNSKLSFLYKDITTKNQTSGGSLKISHDLFKIINHTIDSIRNNLVISIKKEFNNFLIDFSDRFTDVLNELAYIIGITDFYATNAKNAKKFKYYRPSINTRPSINGDKSYIKGNDLRHPIIERLCETEYVPNDVSLGTEDIQGMLIYGTNMVGKSAYMKSIGLAIIMAQSGMFVACENMNYYPYKNIFTRIPSGDDLFKGQSTFAVEISELRNILKRADDSSLVIGDELASGTESISAVSIVAAGIMQLYEKKSSFVFASHLHDLVELEKIKKLKQLRICHLSVIYDDAQKKLIFDRKIKDGQGGTLYGLEVCRALDLNDDFIVLANEFRNELSGHHTDIVGTNTSRYNKNHFIDVCTLCNKKANEVHHIKQQSFADKDGFINFMHKNNKNNLINVCSECHDRIHNKEILVDGYKQTSDGIELFTRRLEDINEYINESDSSECSKENKESDIHNFIKLKRSEKISILKIKELVFENYDQDISIYKINKILKNK